MKKILLIVFAFLVVLHVNGQQSPVITTFIVVRHAEKGNSDPKDPELSPEGTARAARLAQMLNDVAVSAVFSTNYKRTRNTVTPLATAKGVEVQGYESFKDAEINDVLKKFSGGTIVVCGHSNTVPGIVNRLLGKDQFKNLDDSEYDSLFIVSVVENGKTASVTRLHY